jgi:UDP-glucose 4-epimerase
MAVYGSQRPPFIESMRPQPVDPYGIAKFTVEQDLQVASEQFGLRFNVIRPHNVVGIYQNIWDRYRNVLGIFLRRAIRGEPLTVYGDGQQTRAFSDVRYYLEPFEQLAHGHDGETFNLGADRYVSILDLAKMVQSAASDRGLATDIVHLEPRLEVVDAYCDHSKAKEQLGLQDRTDLEGMVSQMFDWALTQPDRKVKNFDYEIRKGLYSFWL